MGLGITGTGYEYANCDLALPLALRLAPPSAGTDVPAEFSLHRRDEIRAPEWAAVGAQPVEAVERRLFVERQFQEFGEARGRCSAGPTLTSGSSRPARWARTLDHGHPSGEAASPARTGLNAR